MIEALREVKREIKWLVSLFALLVLLFVLLHTTPETALRTNVFFMGYPKAALTSDIGDYMYLNITSSEKAFRGYVLTEPPIEKATEGVLDTYQVKRTGFLYFAEYHNDF